MQTAVLHLQNCKWHFKTELRQNSRVSANMLRPACESSRVQPRPRLLSGRFKPRGLGSHVKGCPKLTAVERTIPTALASRNRGHASSVLRALPRGKTFAQHEEHAHRGIPLRLGRDNWAGGVLKQTRRGAGT